MKGETKVDYFHFICETCGSSLSVRLGSDGAVPTITAACAKCGPLGTLKLHKTLPA
jgi:hypothetical protein